MLTGNIIKATNLKHQHLMASAIAADPANLASQIPLDLFVSKKHQGLVDGIIGLADASGNIIYIIKPQTHKTRIFSHHIRDFTLLDADGHLLMTLNRKEDGCWQGYKSTADKELIFQAKRKSLSDGVKTQIEVFITGADGVMNSTTTTTNPHWKLKGNPSQRSCTISDHNSILAQTSLMYKLHQICVGRKTFRLTIYPAENVDRSLIVSLIVIFIYGKI